MTKSAITMGIKCFESSYLAELLPDKGDEVHGYARYLCIPNIVIIECFFDMINLVEEYFVKNMVKTYVE